jgi:hypothetical protein
MMHAARRVVLCIDHTKFGRQSISHLCPLNALNIVITNQLPPPEMRAALSKAGVELIIASPEGAKVALSARKRAGRSETPFTAPEPLPVPAEESENDGFID